MLNRARRHLQRRCFFRPSRDRNRCKDHDQWVYRTKVVCLGMRKVISEREKEKYDRKAHSYRRVTLEYSPQAKQTKDAQSCINDNIRRIERLFLQIIVIQAPVSSPHIKDATAGHPGKPARVVSNVLLRLG